ncbi:cytochrome P450 [Immersiella caudata]|uniref:Cytochrome P450 n=1 Tax=Immersiella caudata TaxID=314043 RepID=A0AA39U2A1_9PEZI|nr:cytochrome P450 [Immersiella caudata]
MEETIPFISNTVAVVRDPPAFWARTLKTMQRLKTEIVQFRLNFVPVYVVVGEQKVNVLFRLNTGFSTQRIHNLFSNAMFGPTDRDKARFAADVTGIENKPVPGSEHIEDRLWVTLHNVIPHEHLLRIKPSTDLANWFFDRFIARTTELFPLGKPTEMLIWDFLKYNQTETAGRALHGNLVFDMNPGYIDAMLKYDLSAVPVAFGPPRWVNPQPYIDREAFLNMTRRYMAKALPLFDSSSSAATSPDWDPTFGSPFTRSIIRWGLEASLDTQTIAGICGAQISIQNANSVPASAWCIMAALTVPDPELLPNLRSESLAAFSGLGKKTFDVQKLVSSPWLQAIYTEVLRLRAIHSVIRDCDKDTVLDRTNIPKGAMVYAPMPIAHNNPIWGVEGHPPEDFWPRRHLTAAVAPDGTKTWEFAVGSSRSGYFFPYGGGLTMCPGRNFAKQEIIGTLVIFLMQFEVEVVGWVMHDGVTVSERPAEGGVGMVVCQPDRELKVKVTRRW